MNDLKPCLQLQSEQKAEAKESLEKSLTQIGTDVCSKHALNSEIKYLGLTIQDNSYVNMLEDLKPFGLSDFTSLITSIQVSLWGNEFLLECVYDPVERLPYKLAFQDCRDLKWNVHSPEDAQESEADLIDIQLGDDNYRKHAVIYTDIFDLLILYGSFRVEKNW